MSFHEVQHYLSTSYHPQTDGQSEVLNRCVETYLRCMCHDTPKDWAKRLPLEEYWYNTNFHSAIQKTPYEIVYGQLPPIHRPYLTGLSPVDTVDRSLAAREQQLQLLKAHLHKAQNRMKQLADKHRSDRQFAVGDWVYLKLQPYRQHSLLRCQNQKLAAKYNGPYQILSKKGSVAYTLKLPPASKIHPTFHVSMLKKHHGPISPSFNTQPIPSQASSPRLTKTPFSVIDTRTIKKNTTKASQWLIHWMNSPPEDASWEDVTYIQQHYPSFDPWGQGSSQEGSIDVSPSPTDTCITDEADSVDE